MKVRSDAVLAVLLLLISLIVAACPNDPLGPGSPSGAKSSNADLASLSLSAGVLSPSFDPEVTSYSVQLRFSVLSIILTGQAADAGASLSANNGVPQDLVVGENAIVIRVTAADGTTKDYSVSVTRAAAETNADLASLTIDGASIAPTFDPNTTSYRVMVDYDVETINAIGTAADEMASIIYSTPAPQNLAVSDNYITIMVKAEDGQTMKFYTLSVRRSANTFLQSLAVSQGSLGPVFDPKRIAYAVKLDNSVTEISLSAVAQDASGTSISYTPSQTMALSTGLNKAEVLVRTSAGDEKAYSLSICRSAPAGVVLGVGPGMAYSSIQAAINAAQDGDTILIEPGLYQERVNLDKWLTLKGNALTPASCIISSLDPLIVAIDHDSPSGNFCRIEGLRIVRPNNGVWDAALVFDRNALTRSGAIVVNRCDIPSGDPERVYNVAYNGDTSAGPEQDVRMYFKNCSLNQGIYHFLRIGEGTWLLDRCSLANGLRHYLCGLPGSADYVIGSAAGYGSDQGDWIMPIRQTGLAGLQVDAGVLCPAFNPNVVSYELFIENDVTSLTFDADTADAAASLSFSPGLALNPVQGLTEVVAVVRAPGDEFSKTYTITVSKNGPMPAGATSPNVGTLIGVPSGIFRHDADPANITTVSAFLLCQHEVTRAEFQAIMAFDPTMTDYSNGTDNPVQNVNWYHAIAFCNKLSIAEGLNPVYSVAGVDFSSLAYADIPLNEDAAWSTAAADWDANGYRLPTEMEWNWAAMGAAGYFGKLYSGWNGRGSAGDCAWYSANSANKTHGVGAKQANELGIFDMSGNVWEWCWDLNGALPTGALADYRGAATGGDRVMKGGGWMDYEATLVLSYRLKYTPSIRGGNVGFRGARNPAPRE